MNCREKDFGELSRTAQEARRSKPQPKELNRVLLRQGFLRRGNFHLRLAYGGQDGGQDGGQGFHG